MEAITWGRDSKVRCPKCGCGETIVKYAAGDDVLQHSCACGYTWTSEPMDKRGGYASF